jgi:hypothetical protein
VLGICSKIQFVSQALWARTGTACCSLDPRALIAVSVIISGKRSQRVRNNSILSVISALGTNGEIVQFKRSMGIQDKSTHKPTLNMSILTTDASNRSVNWLTKPRRVIVHGLNGEKRERRVTVRFEVHCESNSSRGTSSFRGGSSLITMDTRKNPVS